MKRGILIMLIDVSVYKASLKTLWAEAFGDEEEYINIFFDKGYMPCECFGEICGDEVTSVLYLLKGFINIEGRSFEGRYLYAAATRVSFRNKGIMSKLIKEAENYVKKNDLHFIALVPANDKLYEYYSAFGFESVMSNYLSFTVGEKLRACTHKADAADYLSLRRELPCPHFTFGENEWKYAFACLDYYHYDIYKNSDDSFFISDSSGTEVIEFVSSNKNFSANSDILINSLQRGTSFVSCFDMSGYCECKKNKFGMVYFADLLLKTTLKSDIYMNIALD